MPEMIKFLAVVCAPTMAIVARLMDSADDRRDRARMQEHLRLHRQMQGQPR
jgi:hypothetical protein